MPVTSLDLHNNSSDIDSILGSINGNGFLRNDKDERQSLRPLKTADISPDSKTFLQLHTTDDQFPILVRREGAGAAQSPVSPIGLDKGMLPFDNEAKAAADRISNMKHRRSLPPSAIRQPGHLTNDTNMPPLNGILSEFVTAKNTAANRRSVEVKFTGIGDAPKRPGLLNVASKGAINGVPKISSSYSTNDIPTLKTTRVMTTQSPDSVAVQSPVHDMPSLDEPRSQVELPPTVSASIAARKDIPETHSAPAEQVSQPQARQNMFGLQANAAPFGPSAISSTTNEHHLGNSGHVAGMASPFPPGPFYGGYPVQLPNNHFNNNPYFDSQNHWAPNHPPHFILPHTNAYPPFQPQAQPRFADNTSKTMPPRRGHTGDESQRFMHIELKQLKGEIYGLCKDQHGCRFLQKKLEAGDPKGIQLIFDEVAPHVVELMTDPFGNYLIQKLLEHSDDNQRTVLVRQAATDMVKVALNQHGTRALQKMIEFITTAEQIQIVVQALNNEVVILIQDLNGNHVIQKCLNHLANKDAQFIIDAVCTHVVVVGTHRHGCCVIQRCIDHASGAQKGQLVRAITANALPLVQDPFGNYVVQYILDLDEPAFTEPLCLSFRGYIAALSCQKFSSNVIEKSIRVAEMPIKRVMIEEMMESRDLEKMLRDSFANYVVQTAIDYVDIETKGRLIDHIRPLIPSIRNTPHGRRIQSRVNEHDNRKTPLTNAPLNPNNTLLSGVSNLSVADRNANAAGPAPQHSEQPEMPFGGMRGYQTYANVPSNFQPYGSYGAVPYQNGAGRH